MRNMLATLALVFSLALMVSSGVRAGVLQGTASSQSGIAVTAPFFTSTPSEQYATGKLQFDAIYRDTLVWSYDGATSEYAGTYPIGMGAGNSITLRFYPNIETRSLPVEAVAVGEAELQTQLAYTYDRKLKTFRLKPMKGLYLIERNEDGRFAGDIVLDDSVGEGSHVVRIYALVRDAKREDKAFLIIFHWASKRPGVGLVDTLRFRTERWPANTPAPTVGYLNDLFRRAGNGGTGMVFSALIAADIADAGRATTNEAERQRVLEANEALVNRVEGALASATNTSMTSNAVLGQHEARLNGLDTTINSHADSIDGLATNQKALVAGIDQNTQGVADLGTRVAGLENWAAKASQPAVQQPALTTLTPPSTTPSKEVHFSVAFVSGVNQSPTTVEVECASGIKPYRVMDYLKYGISTGTVMDFRIRKPRGQWQKVNFVVTADLEGVVKMITVQ